jgi:hypothetical protein
VNFGAVIWSLVGFIECLWEPELSGACISPLLLLSMSFCDDDDLHHQFMMQGHNLAITTIQYK